MPNVNKFPAMALSLGLATGAIVVSSAGFAEAESKSPATKTSDPEAEFEALAEAVVGGKPWLDARYRFEHVEQDGLAQDANANTLRLRAGYRTGGYRGFSLLLEGEYIVHIGDTDFNDTINGKTDFPVVADPESTEINQANIAFSGFPNTTVRVGRQRFVVDNQRFVGDVGFRQNQQTFDAVTVRNQSLPEIRATYGYLFQVKRLFGEDSPMGDFNTDSHIVNLSYSGFDFGTFTAYGYLLDIDDLPTGSTQTYGLRFSGKQKLTDDFSLLYGAEVARQLDFGNNPADYDVGYYFVEGGVRYDGLIGKLGFEVLEGNDVQAFQTPFGTLHKFQGWADKFLTTPPGGIEDLQATLRYDFKNDGLLSGVTVMGVYHHFMANSGGGSYGDEFDLRAALQVYKYFTVAVKYADYRANGFATDTKKLWLTLHSKF